MIFLIEVSSTHPIRTPYPRPTASRHDWDIAALMSGRTARSHGPAIDVNAAMGRKGTSDDGEYFPRGSSVLRGVHEERAVGLLYGQRALCIGALAPLNYVGTSEHTRVRTMPWKRLVPTGKAFETVFFAGPALADRVLRRVRRLHDRVNGTLPHDAGPFPRGTRYSALDDPEMLWTIAVMMDSAQFFYQLFVGALSEAELEDLWRDYVRFGELWGMDRSSAPRTYRAFREWFDQELMSERMYLTVEARQVGYQTAFEIPLPRRYQAAKRVHDLLLLGSLPPRVREFYGLRFPLVKRTAFKLIVRVLCLARRVAPRRLTHGWNTRFFDMVGETERWRVERGKPTPELWPRKHERSQMHSAGTDMEVIEARCTEMIDAAHDCTVGSDRVTIPSVSVTAMVATARAVGPPGEEGSSERRRSPPLLRRDVRGHADTPLVASINSTKCAR